MKRDEDLTGGTELDELREIRKSVNKIGVLLLVIALLLAAIVFGVAEVSIGLPD